MGAGAQNPSVQDVFRKESGLLLLIQHPISSTCTREPSKGAKPQRLGARVLDLSGGVPGAASRT